MERKSQFLVIAKRTIKQPNGFEKTEYKKIVVSACTKYHAIELAMTKEPYYQTYQHTNVVRRNHELQSIINKF
jgi:hypothetical protein